MNTMGKRMHSDELIVAVREKVKEKEFWLNKLAGEPVKSSFPFDFRKEEGAESRAAVVNFRFSKKTYSELMELSKGSDYTLYIILAAGLTVLINKYTNHNDILIGAPIYRQEIETKFINTILVLRSRLQEDITFRQLLMQMRQTVFEATENYSYPVELLPEKLNLPASQGEFPLFDIVILLESLHDKRYIQHINNNMTFSFSNAGEYIEGVLEYNSLLYRRETTERIITHFEIAAAAFLSNLDGKVSDMDILILEEKRRLLYRLNDTATDYPGDKTIQQLFAEVAEKAPGDIAVKFADVHLTYGEMNKQTNRLARRLRRKGVGADTIVGVLLERSLDMIIGLLAVLKAGGAYLPIDPDTPKNRIITMLEDCKAPLLLTKTGIAGKYAFTALQGLKIAAPNLQLTLPRKQIRNFDGLPFVDRSLVSYKEYHKYIGQAMVKHSIAIQATRGCPFQCAYCFKIWPEKHVFRSHENILEEVKLYYDMGVRRFVFIDDIFNFNRQNSTKFFQSVIREKLDVQLIFPSGFRGDILTKDYIDLVVEAGTVSFALALETASPRLQKLVRKNLDLEKFREICEYICEKYPQIVLELQTMHGLPTETEEEAMMTLDFIKSIKWLDFPYINILKIFPNTKMEQLALESGISKEAISRSVELSYHQLPDTLPFDKSFTLKYQTNFLNEYFLSRERLLHVLPFQMNVLTEDEIVQKYNSYLPTEITSLADLLEFAGIDKSELDAEGRLDEEKAAVPGLDLEIRKHFPFTKPAEKALKILLLDISIFFLGEADMLYDVIEPPLGLMYLLTYLNREYGDKINGKIAKARLDFNSYAELKAIVDEFNPDVMGIRSLIFYSDFFHKSISMIRQWGYDVPIIAGGPYATSNYASLLQDRNIDLAVLGEGELTFAEIIGAIMENGGRLPGEDRLKDIAGIAFIPGKGSSSKALAREIILMDQLAEVSNKESGENLELVNRSRDLAYTIFTSGSSCIPKGTLTSHANVVRVVKNTNYIDLVKDDRILQLSNYAFDGSVFDIYGALLNGARLIMMNKEDVFEPDKLAWLLEKEKITVFFLTTALFNALADVRIDCFAGIRRVLFGGERVSVAHSGKALEYLGKDRIIHVYGPTETTVYATYYNIKEIAENQATIPIGRPIANTSVYVLDQHLNPVPALGYGELYIGGAGLSRGYLNNPELTQEKFVENPFFPGEKLYRSGDLARMMPDGNIEFVDRIDNQVKLRGFRVELGEIESHLLRHEDVKEAIVIDIDRETGLAASGNKYLCAYVVTVDGHGGVSEEEGVKAAKLREYLSGKLPDYMIPSYFMQVDTIPLTVNGKVDRKALPVPEPGVTEEGYVPSGNPVEEKLVEVWQEVMGVIRIGINDNFFEVGGDSIKAIQVSARLKKYGLDLKISDLFSKPTIGELSKCVMETLGKIHQGIVEGELVLTPIQRWFFQNDFTAEHHFNHAVMFYREDGFDEGILERVFTKIVEHHDALRMVYEKEKDNVIQGNRGTNGKLFDFEVFDMKTDNRGDIEKEIEMEANRIQEGIDLETGPLVKSGLFKTGSGDHLLIVIHHLVVDGVSWRILLEDFEAGYRQASKGEAIVFQEKTDSFKRWADKLKEYADSSSALKDLAYWQALEETEIKPLPRDREIQKEKKKYKYTERVTVNLNEEETERLLRKVNWAYSTEINDILLAALGLAVTEWSGVENVLINLEGHGRESIIQGVDISRTVGWFTVQYPVILDIAECRDRDLSYTIKWVKETLRRIPNKGMGYGVLRYLTSGEKKEGICFGLEPEISFNYLGQFGQEDKAGLLKISPISHGESINPQLEKKYAVDVIGMLVEGRLSLSFTYNKYEYDQASIKKLSSIYKSNLLKIIDHCSNCEKKELTPSDLGISRISIDELTRITRSIARNSKSGENPEIHLIYPLSPMQSGLLYHALKSEQSHAYFEQCVLTLSGEIEKSLLENSFQWLVKEYDILRTIFVYKGLEEPLQVVIKERNVQVHYEDIASLSEDETGRYLEEFKRKDKEKGFNLGRDILMRLSLFKTGLNAWTLVWSFHHILMDGWCAGIIYKELIRVYHTLREGKPLELEAVTPYITYIKWLEKQDRDAGLCYWQRYLEGYEHQAVLPGMRKPVKDDESLYILEEYRLIIDDVLTSGLNKIALQNQVTMNTVFEALWGILLCKYNNCDDVVFGTVVSGRPAEIEGIENMVGLFINTIPVRIKYREGQEFSQLLRMVQKRSLSCKLHEYLPLAEIHSNSVLRENLIHHIMAFENYPLHGGLKNIDLERHPGFDIEDMELHEQTHYDFDIAVIPGKRLIVKFNYNALVYESNVMENLGLHLKEIIKQVIDNPCIALEEIEIITAAERRQVLLDFNRTTAAYPLDKTIGELFEEQAERIPGHTAVISVEQMQITYGELNEKSNQLARLLREKGVKRDSLVGILCKRSIDMVVGILAVWKGGGAYLPIDPEYPQERIDFILKDSAARILLSEVSELSNVSEGTEVVKISELSEQLPAHLTHLCYVIYTSGSTGKPKGVMVEHRGMMNHIQAKIHDLRLSSQSIVAQNASQTFDISVWQFFAPLAVGGQTTIYPDELILEPVNFINHLIRDRVTILEVVPSYLSVMLDTLESNNILPLPSFYLEYLLVTGEEVKTNLVRRWFDLYPHVKMVNAYGPTEASDNITHYVMTETPDMERVPIGKPLQNLSIYIVDKYMKLCPPGVKGEIWVSGVGVGRGYLNEDGRTGDAFIRDPFSKKQGVRLYKTGDLGAWLPDGTIEFFGRKDCQVKIRGFRIELGEIENRLLKHEDIKEVVVVDREDKSGNKYLCAYIVPHSSSSPGAAELKEYLSGNLPDYMIPSYFLELEKIPLTANGKIDRKALPEPEGKGMGQEYMGPRDPLEARLVDIWAGVLKLEKGVIGVLDNFFDLGGHSLKATTLVSRIHKELDVDIPPAEIFKTPTIRGLASLITAWEWVNEERVKVNVTANNKSKNKEIIL